MKINTLFQSQRKGVLFFYGGILLTLFFIGCDLEFASNAAIAPGTPSVSVKSAGTDIRVMITPPTIKGVSITGADLKNEDIIYHVYYSARKHGTVFDLIRFAKSSTDKKQAGKVVVAGQSGTSTGTISSLSAETKYYITVVAVNSKIQLLESDPTNSIEATTGKSSTSSVPSGNDKAPGAATIKSLTADGDSIRITITAPTEKGTTGSKANTLNDLSYLIYVSTVDPKGNAQAVVDDAKTNPITNAEFFAKERDGGIYGGFFPILSEEESSRIIHLKDNTKFYVVVQVLVLELDSRQQFITSPLSDIKEVTTATAKTQ